MSIWNNTAIVDLVSQLWDEGRTGTEIAQTIEVRFGVLLTRNAVIAKLDRMGKIGNRAGGVGAAGTSRAQKEARRRKAAQTMATKAEVAVVPVAKPEPVKPPQGWFSMQSKPQAVKPYEERHARVFDPGKLVSFEDLEGHHCRFPVGDPRSDNFKFCGEAKVIGLPYCGKCASIAFVTPEPASHHGVTARAVFSAAGRQTAREGGTDTQESVPAAGEALADEMEDA
jgi:GcrA cell cycle regulator